MQDMGKYDLRHTEEHEVKSICNIRGFVLQRKFCGKCPVHRKYAKRFWVL
jgi:hypothetical protein